MTYDPADYNNYWNKRAKEGFVTNHERHFLPAEPGYVLVEYLLPELDRLGEPTFDLDGDFYRLPIIGWCIDEELKTKPITIRGVERMDGDPFTSVVIFPDGQVMFANMSGPLESFDYWLEGFCKPVAKDRRAKANGREDRA